MFHVVLFVVRMMDLGSGRILRIVMVEERLDLSISVTLKFGGSWEEQNK